jgi:hypothetical protein
MRMPSAASRANSTAQPGSSTITGSPGRSSVRLTMSSAWVAPTVVMMCSGAVCTFSVASLAASSAAQAGVAQRFAVLQRKSCSARVVTLRTAAGMKVDSSHSGGNTPMPGCGLLLILWNMPRISAVALTGCATRAAPRVANQCAVLQLIRWRLHIGLGRVGAHGRGLAHKKPPVLARLHQPLRQQLVIGRHHGGRAHAVLLRALPHRRQARARGQQPVADALGKARRQLLGQG